MFVACPADPDLNSGMGDCFHDADMELKGLSLTLYFKHNSVGKQMV